MNRIRNYKKGIIAFIATVALLFSGIGSLPVQAKNVDANSTFWVEFVDVGQGDCAIIQCDDHYMMIDGGPSSASSIVYTILKNKGIKNLDYMIATHPDADHIGGLSGALNYASVENVYCSVTSHDTKTFNSLTKYVSKQGKNITVPKAGTEFDLGTADVKILAPINNAENTNNNSIVVKVSYGETSFLFMGDAETEEETDLIKGKNTLECDVLKVGHHGSDSSSSTRFLKEVNPKYAIISVGAQNSYGHPTNGALDRLDAVNATVYRTDLQGDITCVSDGKKITVTTEKNVKPQKTSSTASNNSKNTSVPTGTTYVLNTNSKKYHKPTCKSVEDMSAKNTEYSNLTAEQIVAMGYKACQNCKPRNGTASSTTSDKKNETPKVDQNPETKAELKVETQPEIKVQDTNKVAYVLNTNSKKFHYPSCSSVGDMSAKNRRDVESSRDEIIGQGYVPCKRCNP